ncbi:MAG TPA: thiamine diphosphokinase [Chthonomonadales bacterium]|nr:thiamine diphosphokinase [Chthonomonadales bacterium]
MHALILANGEAPPREFLAELRRNADLFIAADGAANCLPGMGLAPDVVLGDFDSLTPAVRECLPEAVFLPMQDQESSDLDKAIAYAAEQGAKRITLTGATGGRLDHALTHISLLLKYHPELDVRLLDEQMEVRVVGAQPVEFRGKRGDKLSLIVFAPAEGVVAEGVLYPLRHETLFPGSRGVSNMLVGDTARVSVRSGAVIACHLRADYGER